MKEQAKIETLRAVLKESQQVKATFVKRLDEQRKLRREKECELSSVNGKLAQTKDLFVKMKDTRDMAHHKNEISQLQAQSLENEIRRKREILKKIEEDITEFSENRNTEVETFEEELSAFSKQFKAAKQEYSSNELTKKIKEAEFNLEEVLQKAKTAKDDELNTSNYLKSLQMEQPSATDNCDIDMEAIWQIVTTDQETFVKQLQITMEELEVARNT